MLASDLMTIAVITAPPSLIWISFYMARRIGIGWLRILARLVSGLGLALSWILLLLITLLEVSCPGIRGPNLWSPDGRFVVEQHYYGGLTVRDIATIGLRRRFSPVADVIFRGDGWQAIVGRPRPPKSSGSEIRN